MQDIDDHLHDLLRAAVPAQPPEDRRPAIRAAAHRRQLRRRAAVATAGVVGAMCVATLALVGLSPQDQAVTAGPSAGERAERVVTVPGLASPIRTSTNAFPIEGYDSFGVVPLAGGAITGSVQTTRDDGTAIAMVAVTSGPRTEALRVQGPSGESVVAAGEGQPLVVLELRGRDPFLVLTIEALDDSGTAIGSVRVTPFIQDPLTCDTNTQMAGGSDVPAHASYIAHLDAYLAAPLPAVCER